MTKLVGILLMVLLVAAPAMAAECHRHELSGDDLTYTAHETGSHTFKGGSSQSHNGYLITVYLEEGETWTVPPDGAGISHVDVCLDPATTTTTTDPPSTLPPPTTTTSTAPPATTTTTQGPEPTTTTVTPSTTTPPTTLTSSSAPPTTAPPTTISELPHTGASVLQLTVAAIWLLFFGTLIVVVARLRRNP